uniref:BRO1 domain-containing protein n=1 Tax=Pseudo-nitzschia australis TaxID=44445 RepID=A0A7S4AXF3_9STRA|mmetsp:Transcript_6527/g.14904  ORF Transcript_6527/g.14904 Transcript_6527/m.14904 type:complete len:425 (-) Transcript_6527:143-1417(-)|eukprot:CAMPEP_0168191708 /NCGR_PEP_ID=MMETSP0139_2-20121125/17663_1 /TAXON_ID=44445 /ORGANISM="Pseudo-nitzschia australis, Strain 10249 10 AB" /LENGTH=424 /DNA_ID=CAMNT_0008114907 /DNA_START=195 /DNA_END=1469 /DNA_ORIENTATION=-
MSLWDVPRDDLSHPDCAIRLASAVHRFCVPKMNPDRKISFVNSFATTGKHEKTRKLMVKADDQRKKLLSAVLSDKISHERVVAEARRYQPYIHQILVSCKFQPEMARLDERLVFEWMSGLEMKEKYFKSEAMMMDLTMCILCEGLGKAGVATECSMAGEFAAASREHAAAAGVFKFLAEDHLPKWVARGSKTNEDDLPVECCTSTAEGLSILFQANAQQMAIATVLIKPGTPNYGLVAKLCMGVEEQLEEFIALMRKEAFTQMSRIEKDFFTLVNFQITLQKALSYYFHARSIWEVGEYGLAIAILSEATVYLRTEDAKSGKRGIPDVARIPALQALLGDVNDLRSHMGRLLREWEKDNSNVFFETVPRSVPSEKKLQKGVRLNKVDKYHFADVDPVLLCMPANALTRTDSDLARELQAKLNAS